MGVPRKFHLYLIECHIGVFDDMLTFLRRERRNEFHLDQTLLTRLATLYES